MADGQYLEQVRTKDILLGLLGALHGCTSLHPLKADELQCLATLTTAKTPAHWLIGKWFSGMAIGCIQVRA